MKLDIKSIANNLSVENLWEKLDDDQITKIQAACKAQFESDAESCQDWRNESKKLMEMAKMTDKTRKSYIKPWQSDIQVPDLIQAAVQFNARSYPEYTKDGNICQAKNFGRTDQKKIERSQRVTKHLNYQLTCQIKEWLPNLDKMLLMLPIVGHMFKVKAYSNALGRMTDTLCMPDQVTINNSPNNPDWDRRISIDYPVSSNYAASKKAAGEWRDVELQNTKDDDVPEYRIVDMYSWYDLDGDGYEEPYTITLEYDTFKLLAIHPRYDASGLMFEYDPANPEDEESRKLVGIEALELVTSYAFIPAPDGSALGIGYGHIGKGLLQGMNMYLNQLADAATLANLGGGFIRKGVFRDDGAVLFEPGEFKITDASGPGPIADSIMTLPVPDPSSVTFQIYQELKGDFQAIAATSEIVSGTEMPANAPATSVLAIIDQAKQGARAILKRINIAMGKEFEVMFRLNKTYLPDEYYYAVGDFTNQQVIAAADYENRDYDIVPVADPNFSSRTERLTRYQAAMQLGIQSPVLIHDMLIDIGFDEEKVQEYIKTNSNPAVVAAQAQSQAAQDMEAAAKAQSALIDKQVKLLDAQTRSIVGKTQAIKNLADAEAVEAGTQLDIYAAQMAALQEEGADERTDESGRTAMAGQPDNEAATQGAGGIGGSAEPIGNGAASISNDQGGMPDLSGGQGGGDSGMSGMEVPPEQTLQGE